MRDFKKSFFLFKKPAHAQQAAYFVKAEKPLYERTPLPDQHPRRPENADQNDPVKRMLVPDWAKKKCFLLLCPIGEQHLLSSVREFFRTRRLLSRHSCPVRSPSFPNQKRWNYRWVENCLGCSAGQERYLAYSFAHNSVYLPKNIGSFQFSIQQHCRLGITVNIYFPLFWMMYLWHFFSRCSSVELSIA